MKRLGHRAEVEDHGVRRSHASEVLTRGVESAKEREKEIHDRVDENRHKRRNHPRWRCAEVLVPILDTAPGRVQRHQKHRWDKHDEDAVEEPIVIRQKYGSA
jgi:hypothetical protein